MMSKEVDNLIRFARAYCAEKLPWFAPALFQCQIELTKQVPLAAIDEHLNIYFNPEAVEKMMEQGGDKKKMLEQLGFVWIHEISHILREHGNRAKAFKAKHALWNIAADLEINDGEWEGLAPPDMFPLLFPTDYDLPTGQLTEYYYQKLLEEQERKKRKQSQSQSSEDTDKQGPGNPSDSSEDTPPNQSSDNQENPPSNSSSNPNEKQEEQEQEPNYHDEGSGVHGQPRAWELDEDSENKLIEEKQEGASKSNKQKKEEIEVEMIRNAVAESLKEHRNNGNIPGGWERWAEEQLKPKVNWKQALKFRMGNAINKGVGSRIDYSYNRPSRRQSVYGSVVMPSLRGDISSKIACVVDTSGSIRDNELSQIIGEVLGVLKAFLLPVTIIPCDARAYEPIQISVPSDIFKMKKMPGGGGTNMVIGIEAALDLKPRPDCILVLTDGFTPYPQKKYDIPVIFGILLTDGQIVRRPPNPPWKSDTVIEIPLY